MGLAFEDVPLAVAPDLAVIKHLLGTHRRHLAGRARTVADLFLLRELMERLRAHAKRVTAAPALRDLARQRAKVLEIELRECKSAYIEPATVADRANQLAIRANQQFLLYRILFAGRARSSRRPGVLERLYLNLKTILEDMEALDTTELATADVHERNMEVVRKELATLYEEGSQVVTVRLHTTRDAFVRQLGADANVEMRDHKKLARDRTLTATDLPVLGGICDRLGEVVAQMVALTDETDDSVNLANLRLAARNLIAFEGEYARLVDAAGAPAPPDPPAGTVVEAVADASAGPAGV